MPKFEITARRFNSLESEIKGKISSIKERRTGLIKELEHRIERAKSVLKGINDPLNLYQKKRRLATFESRLSRLQADHVSDVVRLCFGFRKLFRAQYHLEENGYTTLAAWKKSRQECVEQVGSNIVECQSSACSAQTAISRSLSPPATQRGMARLGIMPPAPVRPRYANRR